MKLNQIPKDLIPLEIGEICDMYGCFNDAEHWWQNGLINDPDSLAIWSLCGECSAAYEGRESHRHAGGRA